MGGNENTWQQLPRSPKKMDTEGCACEGAAIRLGHTAVVLRQRLPPRRIDTNAVLLH